MTNSYKKYLFALTAILLLNGAVDAAKRKYEVNEELPCKRRKINSEEEKSSEEPIFYFSDPEME